MTVLSIKDVLDVKNAYIIFDSRKRISIFVFFSDKEFEFHEYRNGLYYYDYSDTHKINNGFASIQTVEEIAEKYTKRHVWLARDVTDLQQYLFWPGTDWLMRYINDNQINNCGLTEDDVMTRQHIYGTA